MSEKTLDLVVRPNDPQLALDRLAEMTPASRHLLERQLGDATGLVRKYNDTEIRAWCEAGKTQTWIAQQCDVSRSLVAKRYRRLGLEPTSNRGAPRQELSRPVTIPDGPHTNGNGKANGKPKKSWVDRIEALSSSLSWAVENRPPPTKRLLAARAELLRMLRTIDGLLAAPERLAEAGVTEEEFRGMVARTPMEMAVNGSH
jgi:hypothetical protein